MLQTFGAPHFYGGLCNAIKPCVFKYLLECRSTLPTWSIFLFWKFSAIWSQNFKGIHFSSSPVLLMIPLLWYACTCFIIFIKASGTNIRSYRDKMVALSSFSSLLDPVYLAQKINVKHIHGYGTDSITGFSSICTSKQKYFHLKDLLSWQHFST